MTVALEQGVQTPRVSAWPRFASSRGKEALELAERFGLVADPWQEHVVEQALGVRKDERWSAFEVGVNVARQNGKGGIIEIRELAGLFLFEERLIIHSAHEFATSIEAFLRMEALLESCEEFSKLVKSVSRSHGDEGFKLLDGRRIRYRTRTKGGGRGFSCDCLILDEAMFISEFAHGALLPTLSARPNPQVWYTGSAVDQQVHDKGIVFARVRERGMKGNDPGLAYFEWSADFDSPDELDEQEAMNEEHWAQANPGLGIRIMGEHIALEQRSMDSRTFAVERLGVGDWPDTSAAATIIDLAAWGSLAEVLTEIPQPVLAFDVEPFRTSASVCVAGAANPIPLTLLKHQREGIGWVVPEILAFWKRNPGCQLVCDGGSPAAALIPELEREGARVTALDAREYGRSCGGFFDLVDQKGLRHDGNPLFRSALKAASVRPLGDAWAWDRKKSTADITPLVAATLAVWGAWTKNQSNAWAGAW